MKILCLYNNDCAEELSAWLESRGHETVLWRKRLDAGWCRKKASGLVAGCQTAPGAAGTRCAA